MNFKPFYSLNRLLVNGKISRRRFIVEYGIRQREQGITPARKKKGGKP